MLLFACAADLNSPEFRAAETEAIRDIQRIHQAETQYFPVTNDTQHPLTR
jgi:hypothetical protein